MLRGRPNQTCTAAQVEDVYLAQMPFNLQVCWVRPYQSTNAGAASNVAARSKCSVDHERGGLQLAAYAGVQPFCHACQTWGRELQLSMQKEERTVSGVKPIVQANATCAPH